MDTVVCVRVLKAWELFSLFDWAKPQAPSLVGHRHCARLCGALSHLFFLLQQGK
jgi:hypothetical protein